MSVTPVPVRRGGRPQLLLWTVSVALAPIALATAPSGASALPTSHADTVAADGTTQAAVEKESTKPAPTAPLADAPLDRWRTELLQYAVDTATRIPLHPHIKDRTKAQSAIVSSALALDQPVLAIQFAEPIANWRRGDSYAAIAFWAARRGHEVEARRLLEIATRDMEREEEEWRRDRVRAGIARTYALFGDDETAVRLEEGLLPGETGKATTARALRAGDDDFDLLLDWAQRTAALNSFDLSRNAIDVLLGLHDRFYADEERRAATERTIRGAWNAVPLVIRLDVLKRLVEIANAHGDRERAIAITDEVRNVLTSNPWLPEDEIAMGARLAALLHASGDTAASELLLARSELLYDEAQDRIGTVFRAGALRALAEGWAASEDNDMARRVYGRAVDVALENRNARPRAEDLSAIAASMAERGIEPDDELRAKLLQARDRLVPPW